jgi:hypothetical protein
MITKQIVDEFWQLVIADQRILFTVCDDDFRDWTLTELSHAGTGLKHVMKLNNLPQLLPTSQLDKESKMAVYTMSIIQ